MDQKSRCLDDLRGLSFAGARYIAIIDPVANGGNVEQQIFALLKNGRYEDALKFGQAALSRGHTGADIRARVAQAALGSGDLKLAQDMLVAVVKDEPKRAEYLGLLGEVCLRRGDRSRAAALLNHAGLLGSGKIVRELLACAQKGQAPPANLTLVPQPGRNSARISVPPVPPPTRDKKPSLPPPFPGRKPEARAKKPSLPPPFSPGGAEVNPKAPPEADYDPLDDAPTAFAKPVPPAPEPPAPNLPRAAPEPPAPEAPGPTSQQRRPAPARPSPAPAAPHNAGANLSLTDVMPRVLGPYKPKNAAAAPLREAAAIGHHFINALLSEGLVSVPGVAEPDVKSQSFSKRRKPKWGRTAEKTLVFLLMLGVLMAAGGVGFKLYRSHLASAGASRKLTKAADLGVSGSLVELRTARELLLKAQAEAGKSKEIDAAFAELEAAMLILYGLKEGVNLPKRLEALGKVDEGKSYYQKWLFASVVRELVDSQGQASELLAKAEKLAPAERTAWVHWGYYRLLLREKRVSDALTLLANMEASAAKSHPLLLLARANYGIDTGNFDEAATLFDAVLETYPRHTLAMVGKAMLRNELNKEPAVTMEDLKHTMLADLGRVEDDEYANLGSRGSALRHVAMAGANMLYEYYADAQDSLDKAAKSADARVRAYAGRYYVFLGEIERGNKILEDLPDWFAGQPAARRLKAQLLLSHGEAEDVMELLDAEPILASPFDYLLRGRAALLVYDRVKAKEWFGKAHELVPEEPEIESWLWFSTIASGDSADKSLSKLRELSRGRKSRNARMLYGWALRLDGNSADSERALRMSVEDLTKDEPAPLKYLSHQLLAEYHLELRDANKAQDELKLAKKDNSKFFPLLGTEARIRLERGNRTRARELLEKLMTKRSSASGADELEWARFLYRDGRTSEAKSALEQAWAKGAYADQVLSLAQEVDRGFADRLKGKPR